VASDGARTQPRDADPRRISSEQAVARSRYLREDMAATRTHRRLPGSPDVLKSATAQTESRSRRRSALSLLLSLAGLLAVASTSSASILGDSIQGAIEFDGLPGVNFFDPANGQVPAGSSGIQPNAVVIDPDPTFVEFLYTDGTCALCRTNIDVDVDATTILVSVSLIDTDPASNLAAWNIWIIDIDRTDGGPGGIVDAQVTSSDFTGFSIVAFTADSIHLRYDGGQDLDAGTPNLDALITLSFDLCAGVDCSPFDGECSVASCNPTNGMCDLFAPKPVGTVCRPGSGDVCDPDEVCDGTVAPCPADVVQPSGFVCLPGSGDLCDPDEVCSGVAGAACPADSFEPATTVCNPGSGDLCDPDELCPGVAGAACPADTVASAGTVCLAGSGDLCDPDEV
jgi:hypothetical protein